MFPPVQMENWVCYWSSFKVLGSSARARFQTRARAILILSDEKQVLLWKYQSSAQLIYLQLGAGKRAHARERARLWARLLVGKRWGVLLLSVLLLLTDPSAPTSEARILVHHNFIEKWANRNIQTYTDSTKINRPGHNIRMYWTNFQRPTAYVQKNIFGKTRIGAYSPHFYASFGTFCIKIGQLFEALWVFEVYLKIDN